MSAGGCTVDELGTHSLSCRKNQGHHPHHAGINDLIKKTLVSAGIPAHLEPTGLCCSDSKRPNGATIIP